jgi:hypothetical protein
VRCSRRLPTFSTLIEVDASQDTCISLPVPPPGRDSLSTFLTSNDYEFFVRSHDNEGKADGTPAAVKFHVNFSPVLRASGLFPGPGAVIDSSDTAVNDTLTIRFVADDFETPPPVLSYRTVLDGVFGTTIGPVADTSLLFERRRFPSVGEHTIRYTATDPGKRTDELVVNFTVVP